MVTAIRGANSSVTAASVSPAIKGGTGNDVNDLKAFQLLSLLANPQNATLNEGVIERIYNAPSDAELLKLSPQALDLLNGVAPPQDNPTQLSLSLYLPTSHNPDSETSGLALTPLQLENLSSIIAQFANEPLTLNTFVQLQKALAAARINPEQISLKNILEVAFYATP